MTRHFLRLKPWLHGLIAFFLLCFTSCIRPGTELTERAKLEAAIAKVPGLEVQSLDAGFAHAFIKNGDEFIGNLFVNDLVADPARLEKYKESKIMIAGFPGASANYLSNETLVLVGKRIEVAVRGEGSLLEEVARIAWLNDHELFLDKLSRVNGPPVLWLVTVLVVAVIFLLVLILVFKVQAFLSLLLASIFVGIGSGMALDGVISSVINGMGSSLGFIATIIGLGAILGKVLEYSGGAETLARSMLNAFGEKRAPWAMLVTGFLISIPVFFDVGLVILISIVYAMARDSKKSLLYFGLPLIAGMATTHAFIPPTPGPILVAQNLGVGLGWVILFGAIVGFPTAVVAGPIVGGWLANKHFVPVPDASRLGLEDTSADRIRQPGLLTVLLIIGLPIVLILVNTVLTTLIGQGKIEATPTTGLLIFIGHPIIALILSTMLSLYLLGSRCGASRDQLMEMSTSALGPAGIIILVTGAGGVFKQILGDSGVGQTLAELLSAYPLSPLVLAYIFAVVVRVTQGSATVSMIAASSLIAPVMATYDLSDPHKALVVIAIAAGATILSHVNDSGFWIVNRYFGMSENLTLRTWTVVTTVISVVGFLITLVLSLFL